MQFSFGFILLFVLMSCLMASCEARSGPSNMNIACEETGTCVTCRPEELDQEYCKESGRRIRIRCKDGPNDFDDYKACSKTSEDDQIEVIMFQVAIGIVGGLAYWGVQARKKYTMSLFDVRKQR
jgi:hypothetical protein